MKRIVPDYKTVLAFGLTYDQAINLMDQIRAREDCYLSTRGLWLSSHKSGTWYVYFVDEELRKAFVANPESFVFEVPG